MRPIVCIRGNSKWAQLHVLGPIVNVNGPNCMYWTQLLILVPIFGSQSHLGPRLPDHVFGTNDHVFAPKLRHPIILRPNTVNQSYCIVYFSPSWDQVTYPRGTHRYWSWSQFGPIIWFDQRRWAHLSRKLSSSLYESQSEGLTFRDQSECKDFWNWNDSSDFVIKCTKTSDFVNVPFIYP